MFKLSQTNNDLIMYTNFTVVKSLEHSNAKQCLMKLIPNIISLIGNVLNLYIVNVVAMATQVQIHTCQ